MAKPTNILTTRIDEFGVAQPFISKPDANGRIYIELPGADNTDRIRNIIQSSAVLEFYETVDASVSGELLVKANEMLVGILGLEEAKANKEAKIDTSNTTTVPDTTKNELSDDLSDLGNDLSDIDNIEGDTSKTSGLNPLFDVLQPNVNTQDGGGQYWAKGCVVGYVAKKDLAKVKSYLEAEEIQSMLDAARIKLAWSAKPIRGEDGTNTGIYMLYGLKNQWAAKLL
ncbi:MAG: hypothetical protein LRY27_01995 [Chitinophagales bacterium]|nr:hypothetical protein [Chitinophagales bacterium]